MFPLEFPLGILERHSSRDDIVIDPFSGRGTTNFASRMIGLQTIGIDSSPVAASLTQAKLSNATPASIVRVAQQILGEERDPEIPTGEFWRYAFDRSVLKQMCQLREELVQNSRSEARAALKGIVLGALHGPLNKGNPSYFSNQAPRTFAPKPNYAVRFWKMKGFIPPKVDVLEIVRVRAERYYQSQPKSIGVGILGDSRDYRVFERLNDVRISWVITSPPYYGMRTYISDQWIRNWFVGGPADVDYSTENQIEHRSPELFSEQLGAVWHNVAAIAKDGARMVMRFGSVPERDRDAVEIARMSLAGSPWRLSTIRDAGNASQGKRQVAHFVGGSTGSPRGEFDLWARLEG